MKTQPTSRARRKVPRQRPDAQTATAPQTHPAPAPAASTPPPPPAATAPAKRRLFGLVFGGDANGSVKGNLVSFGAEYLPGLDAVRLDLRLTDHRFVALHLDHIFARAAIGTHRQALSEFARFHRGMYSNAWAEHPARAQLTCLRLSDSSPPDEGFQSEFLPQRDLIQLSACFSCGVLFFSLSAYLTRAEAEALLHDLERALVDLERYGDIGI